MLTISSVAVSPVPAQGPVAARVPASTPVRASDNVSARNQGLTTPVVPAGTGAAVVQGANTPPALPPVNPTETVLRTQNFDNAAAPERFQFSTAERVAAQALGERVGSHNAPALAPSNPAAPAASPAFNPTFNVAAPAAGAAAQATAAAPGQARVPGQGVQGGQSVQAGPGAQLADPAQQAEQARPAEQAQAGAAALQEQRQNAAAAAQQVPNPFQEALEARVRDLIPNAWSASRFAVDQLIGEEARAAQAARAERLAPQPSSPLERALEAAAENYQRTSSLPEPPSVGVQVDRLI